MLGSLLQFLIQRWLWISGKKINIQQNSWMSGPSGLSNIIGDTYYQVFAEQEGLSVIQDKDGGLLQHFDSVLNTKDPLLTQLNPRIKHFYEHTALYKLEVWAEWYNPLQWFAKILIRTVSKRMNQLNIPLSPLATSRGMSSEIISLRTKDDEQQLYACWLRKLSKTHEVVYAGFYSFCQTPALAYPCVKVVFPLPKGNVTVILRVEIQSDGSVKLISDNQYTNGPGYYRTLNINDTFRKIKKIPLLETIHVFEDEEGVLRTDHLFYFMRIKMLHLHYKMVLN